MRRPPHPPPAAAARAAAAVAHERAPVTKPAPRRHRTAETAKEPVAAGPVPTFVNHGDREANDEAIRAARASLSGVRHISVTGPETPMLADLKVRAAEFVQVDEGADVVIRFEGNVEHLRFRKKRRAGIATISRHGHAVFLYEMPPETYLIGDTPAGEFARVLRQILQP